MKNLRKMMGVGSYTTNGFGMTSYCMSDGQTYTTRAQYDTCVKNLTKHLGEPEFTDKYARYWFCDEFGTIILPKFQRGCFNYVELDKTGTRHYFNMFKAGKCI